MLYIQIHKVGKKKYKNIPTERILQNGTIYKFSSIKEAKRYDELVSLLRQGLISDLQMQVSFVIIPAQYETVKVVTKSGKEKTKKKLVERKTEYVADFVYTRDGAVVVEDVKGFRNSTAYSVYVIKRKLMLLNFGIRVVEV